MQMAFVVVIVIFFVVIGALCALGIAGYVRARKKAAEAKSARQAHVEKVAVENAYKVSYAPPQFEWSGHSSGILPVKTLSYKQYDCLEDARYGFRIVGVHPSARDRPQPHKTRAHGLKTVASLARHGFLAGSTEEGYVITDHGLNALEVCSVRY